MEVSSWTVLCEGREEEEEEWVSTLLCLESVFPWVLPLLSLVTFLLRECSQNGSSAG